MYSISYQKGSRKGIREGIYYISGFYFSSEGFEYSSTTDLSEAIKLTYSSCQAVYDLLCESLRRDPSFKEFSVSFFKVDNS